MIHKKKLKKERRKSIRKKENPSGGALKIASADQIKYLKYKKSGWKKDIKRNWPIYLLFVPVAAYFIIFNYVPMLGVLMAFQKVDATNVALFGDQWIGFDNFKTLFTSSTGSNFGLVIRNTAVMSLMSITIGFVCPVILAILVSEVRLRWFKRTVQTATYMPYFVSAVVVCAIMKELVGDQGVITAILGLFGYKGGNLLAQADPPTFWFIYLLIDIWQNAGYSSIVFVAAIAAIDRSLYEAAAIDGASRFKRILHVTIPCILPTIVMMFTVKMGTMITAGFDKVILLYNNGIFDTADTIYSYTYRLTTGTQGSTANFGLAAASGLFQSVISVALLMGSNYLSRAVAKTSLF